MRYASPPHFSSQKVEEFICLFSLHSKRSLLNFLQKVSLWKKVHVIYSFFTIRKVIAHVVTFAFYCIVLPATVLAPEVVVPKWGAVYIPSIITLLNAVGTPRLLESLFSCFFLVYLLKVETFNH